MIRPAGRPWRSPLLLALAMLPVSCSRAPAEQPADESVVYSTQRISWPAHKSPVLSVGPGEQRRIRSVLNVDQPLDYGEYVWNEDGVPRGATWVLVDLEAQTLSVFRGADEIGTTVALYGVDDKPTPTGHFKVLAKLKDHLSSTYDAEMPYTLRLTNDGIAIHASDVRGGVGTHGCIGVPLEFGSQLFNAVRVGDEVIVARSVHKRVTST